MIRATGMMMLPAMVRRGSARMLGCPGLGQVPVLGALGHAVLESCHDALMMLVPVTHVSRHGLETRGRQRQKRGQRKRGARAGDAAETADQHSANQLTRGWRVNARGG